MKLLVRLTILASALSIFFPLTSVAVENEGNATIRMGTRPSEVITAKVTVSNLRISYDFYTQVIGLKEIKTPGIATPPLDDPQVSVAEVCLNFSGSLADPFICLLKQRGLPPTPDQAKLFWISFKVPDARATRERLEAAGSLAVGELTQFRGLLIGFGRDPDGYSIQFLQAETFAH